MRIRFVFPIVVAAAIIPVVATADPVPAPIVPGPFVGAPTTSGPQGGSFTMNFDDRFRFEGFGGSSDRSLRPFVLPVAVSLRPSRSGVYLREPRNRVAIIEVLLRVQRARAAVAQALDLQGQLRSLVPAAASSQP